MSGHIKIGDKIKFTTQLNNMELEGTIISYDFKTTKFKIDLGLGSMFVKQEELIIKEIIK
jgi:hypothetical protein